jgi:hypothetical protein
VMEAGRKRLLSKLSLVPRKSARKGGQDAREGKEDARGEGGRGAQILRTMMNARKSKQDAREGSQDASKGSQGASKGSQGASKASQDASKASQGARMARGEDGRGIQIARTMMIVTKRGLGYRVVAVISSPSNGFDAGLVPIY